MIFELVTTRNCNLDCQYCFEGKKNNDLMLISDIEQIVDFIESVKKSGIPYDKKDIQVDFNGGETLLNKKFILEFIKKTRNLDYKYTMTTNGILVDQELIDLLNEYNINIQISLDGQKESHDLNRVFYNGEGSFNTVLRKLKELQEKCPNITINIACVITPDTVQNFSQNIKFLLENGFYDIGTNVCSDYEWTEDDYKVYKKELSIVGDLYIKSIEENNYFSFTPFRYKIENALKGLKKGKCDAIKGQLAILPDGKILPCGVFIGCENEKDFYIGDIKKGLDNKKMNKFFDDLTQIDYSFCKQCSLFGRCKNDCLALNNRVNKDILKCDVVTCNKNQIEIFEVDRILQYFFTNRSKNFYKYFKNYLTANYMS